MTNYPNLFVASHGVTDFFIKFEKKLQNIMAPKAGKPNKLATGVGVF